MDGALCYSTCQMPGGFRVATRGRWENRGREKSAPFWGGRIFWRGKNTRVFFPQNFLWEKGGFFGEKNCEGSLPKKALV